MNGKKARHRRRRQPPMIHQPDPRWADAVERASDRDRTYFAAHPDADMYIRRRMPGEYGPREAEPYVQQATHTRVQQVAPGFRLRHPMVLLLARDYPTGDIPCEHIEAFIAHHGADISDAFAFDTSQLEDE